MHGRNMENWFRKNAGRDARYDYLYNEGEIDEWKIRAEEMLRKTAKLFIIANNHFQGQALVNAFQLKSLLEGHRVDVPLPLLESYPALVPYSERGPAGLDLY